MNTKIFKTDTFDTWRLGTNENGRNIGDIDLLNGKVTRHKAIVHNKDNLTISTGDIITGDISESTAVITSVIDQNNFYVSNISGDFIDSKKLKTVVTLDGGVSNDFTPNDVFETANHSGFDCYVFSWNDEKNLLILFGDVTGLKIGDTVTSANTTTGLTIQSISFESIDSIGETVTVSRNASAIGSFEINEINRDLVSSINQIINGQIIDFNLNGISFSSDSNGSKIIFGSKKVGLKLTKLDSDISFFKVINFDENINGIYEYDSLNDWWFNSEKGVYGYSVVYDSNDTFIFSSVNNFSFGDSESSIYYKATTTDYPWNVSNWSKRIDKIVITDSSNSDVNGSYSFISAENIWKNNNDISIAETSNEWQIIDDNNVLYTSSTNPLLGTSSFVSTADSEVVTTNLESDYSSFTESFITSGIFTSSDFAINDTVSQVVQSGETVTAEIESLDENNSQIVLKSIVESNGYGFAANDETSYPENLIINGSLSYLVEEVYDVVVDPHIQWTPETNSFSFQGVDAQILDLENINVIADRIQNNSNFLDLLNSGVSLYVDGDIQTVSGNIISNKSKLVGDSNGNAEIRNTDSDELSNLTVSVLYADRVEGDVAVSNYSTNSTNSENVKITNSDTINGYLPISNSVTGNSALSASDFLKIENSQIISTYNYNQKDSVFKLSQSNGDKNIGVSIWYDSNSGYVKTTFENGIILSTENEYYSKYFIGTYVSVNSENTLYEKLGNNNTSISKISGTNTWLVEAVGQTSDTLTIQNSSFTNGGKIKVTPLYKLQTINLDGHIDSNVGDEIIQNGNVGYIEKLTYLENEDDGVLYTNVKLRTQVVFTVGSVDNLTNDIIDTNEELINSDVVFSITPSNELLGTINSNIKGDLVGNTVGNHSGTLDIVNYSSSVYGSTKHYPLFGTEFDSSASVHGDENLFYVPTEHKLGIINVAINSTSNEPGYLTINSQYGNEDSETRYQGWEGSRIYHDPGNSLEDTGILKVEKRVNSSSWTKGTIDAEYFTGTAEYANVAREAIGVVNNLTLNQDQDIVYTEEHTNTTIDYLEEKYKVYFIDGATVNTGTNPSPGDIFTTTVTVSSINYEVEFYLKSFNSGTSAVLVQRNYNNFINMEDYYPSSTITSVKNGNNLLGTLSLSTTDGTYVRNELEIKSKNRSSNEEISATCLSDAFRLKPQSAPPIELSYSGTIVLADGVNWNPDPGSPSTNKPYPVYYDGENWYSLI